MKKLESQMLLYIKQTPQARERRNKIRCIGNVMRMTHMTLREFSPEVMDTIVNEIEDYSRYWRKILANEPKLRGNDYSGRGFKDKKVVEQEKQLEMGTAEVGYHEELPW